MLKFRKRLYRERRRLVAVAAFTFLGGYIAFFKTTTVFHGIPFSVLSGLAFMVGLTGFLMFLVVIFPKIRHSAESVALSLPVLSLMGVFSSTEDGGLSSSAGIYMAMLSYIAISVYGGTWVDRYLPRRPMRFRSVATSNLPPEELWPYLTVTPDTFPDYGGEDTLAMEWIEPGVSFREISKSGELAKIEEIHTIEINEPRQRYHYSFDVPDAAESVSLSRGRVELQLMAKGHGTRLETNREFDRVSIRAKLFVWMDDGMGRRDDEMLQTIEAAPRGLTG